jgi:hypothetical protein
MKLPNAGEGVVPTEKIIGYLLSFSHPDGRGKAQFFARFGFSAGNWQVLASALLDHAAHNEAARVENSSFGTRYIVEGIIIKTAVHSPQRAQSTRRKWFSGGLDAHLSGEIDVSSNPSNSFAFSACSAVQLLFLG